MNSPPAALMDRLVALLGEPSGAAEKLAGGITNRNYRVRLGGGDYVVRITSPESALLGIDRRAEHAAATIAAELGIAPRVAAFLDDAGYLVTVFPPWTFGCRRRSCAAGAAGGGGTGGPDGA